MLKWQHDLLLATGALALVLALCDGALSMVDRNLQASLNERQQFVQQTVPLENLYRELANALAQMGARGNDRELLDMLAAQGLNVSVGGTPAGGANAAGAK